MKTFGTHAIFLRAQLFQHGCANLKLGNGVLERFLVYRWPGNIRELENIVERIVILTYDGEVGIADLPHFLQSEPNPVEAIRLHFPPNGICFGGLEREVLLQALQQSNWEPVNGRASPCMSLETLNLSTEARSA